MRTIIAGGRDYFLNDNDVSKLDSLKDKISLVISGGARGVDSCGEKWAKDNNIPIEIYPADWNTHGKSAGYIRNKQMAEVADCCILFKGGRGTEMMFKLAKEYKLELYDFRVES
jgi:hypothetical protein